MIELDNPLWSELSHAHGRASPIHSAPSTRSAGGGFGGYGTVPDIPSLLRQLEANPRIGPGDARTEPWFSLWSALCHQGDIYTASYAAVPHLVRIAFTVNGVPDWQFFDLPTAIEIARATGKGPEIPPILVDSYFDALRQLHTLAFRVADETWDEVFSRAVTAALVVSKGHALLGEAILELDPDTVKEFRIRQGLEECDQ